MKCSRRNHIKVFVNLIFLLAFLSLTTVGKAQTNAETPKVAERKIKLNVTVADEYGRYIKDLKIEDFQASANGKDQKLESINMEDQPMSIGILIDISASMSPQMDRIRYGLVEFLNKCNPENEYFLAVFNEETRQLLDFTQDPKKLFETIQNLSSIEPQNNTAMYDAVKFGFDKLSKAKFDKRVLFLVGDGQDNESETGFGKIRKSLERDDILMYAVGLMDGRTIYTMTGLQGKDFLDRLTSPTGGKSFRPKNDEEMLEIFQRIAVELCSQYEIVFVLDNETYEKAKEKNKGIKLKIKAEPTTFVNNKGKEKESKSYPRTRQKIFFNN